MEGSFLMEKSDFLVFTQDSSAGRKIKEKLNMDLFSQLICFFEATSREFTGITVPDVYVIAKEFQETHNVFYMGEMMQRFEGKGFIKDNKDLLTLVFTITNLTTLAPLDAAEDQVQIYEEAILCRLKKKFDFFAAMAFFVSAKTLKQEEFDFLFEQIEKHIACTTDFFDLLLIRDFLFHAKHIKPDVSAKITLSLLPALCSSVKKVTIDVFMDADLLWILVDFMKGLTSENTKKMKPQGILAALKAMSNLQVKEISENENKKIQALLGLQADEVSYLNYLYGTFKTSKAKPKKFSTPGYLRLQLKYYGSYLKKNEPIPKTTKKALSEESAALIIELFKTNAVPHLENFVFFMELLEKNKTTFLFCGDIHQYILDDEIFINAMSDGYKEEMFLKFLTCTEQKEKLEYVLALAKKYKIYYYKKSSAVKNLIEHGLISLADLDFLDSDEHLLNHAVQHLRESKNLKELRSFLVYYAKNRNIYNLPKCITAAVTDFARYQPELATDKDYLLLEDDVFFIYLPEEYDKYLCKRLMECKDFMVALGISEADKEMLLRQVVTQGLLNDTGRENLRKSFLNTAEIEWEETQKLIAKIKQVENTGALYKNYLPRINSKEAGRAMFDSLWKNAIDNNTARNTSYEYECLLKIMQVEGISEKELFAFMSARGGKHFGRSQQDS